MRSGEDSSSSRDRHHHHHKKSRKRDDSEPKEDRLDLRNRLNELKSKSSKDQSERGSSYDKDQQQRSTHHRTKQIHDYEPYHKSSVSVSSTSSRSHHRSSRTYSSEKEKPYKKHRSSSVKIVGKSHKEERSIKPAKIIDAEVNEIISEEDNSMSEHSDSEINKKKVKASASSSDGESDGSVSSKSKASSRSRSSDDLDEEEREAQLKAKLKEKFLKSQLDKKYKDIQKGNTPTSTTGSRSPSPGGSIHSADSDNDGTVRSSKRDTDSGASDATEKFENNGVKSGSESPMSVASESSRPRKKKHSNGHKKRKSIDSTGTAGSDTDSESRKSSSSHKKRSKRARSTSSTQPIEKANEADEVKPEKVDSEPIAEEEAIEEVIMEPPPPPIIYYCATQGCRSVEEFECLNKIEEGAYGVVYRAKDKKSNTVVALKRLKMEKEREGFPITSIREVDTLLKSQHVNVVTVREIVVGSNMDKIYMVMDYVEHDLKSLMQYGMKKPFQMSEVKCLMKQILSGIAHLHDNWIIHRDLKTSNLLLSHKGVLKIADFGLAREYGSPLKEYTPVVVTLWYRCPELLLNTRKYSTSVDIWSVGTIFGELMLLKALFPGKNEKDQLDKIFKDLGTPNEKIWPGFKDLPLTKKLNFPEFPYNTLRSRFGTYLSDNGFELINKLLTYDPERRISADAALKHEFFQEPPFPIDAALFPTWPAKSEGQAPKVGKKVADSEPRAPSAGKMYEQLLQDDNTFVLQFPAQSAGFTLR